MQINLSLIFKIISLFIVLTFMAPRSHAGIGLLVGSKPVSLVGTIGLGVSVIVTGSSFVSDDGWNALGLFILGVSGGALSLIILDENNLEKDLEFYPIHHQNGKNQNIYSTSEINIYNSEIDILNNIILDLNYDYDESVHDLHAKWLEYSNDLSSETIKIAKDLSKHAYLKLQQNLNTP